MPEKVTEFATGNISIYLQKYDPTRDELQQEYRYYLAHRMIKRLYMSEAITQEEYTDLELTFDYCHELSSSLPFRQKRYTYGLPACCGVFTKFNRFLAI